MHKEYPECNTCHKKFQTKYDLNTHYENTHKRTADIGLSERTKLSKSTKLLIMKIFDLHPGPGFN